MIIVLISFDREEKFTALYFLLYIRYFECMYHPQTGTLQCGS